MIHPTAELLRKFLSFVPFLPALGASTGVASNVRILSHRTTSAPGTRGPDFLGIGAQKAGTTWLWTQLKQHPDVWMPPRKELHYFDRNFPKPNFLAEPSVRQRLFGPEPRHEVWRKRMQLDLQKSIRSRNWSALSWYTRFYFGAGDDEWYRTLFPSTADFVRGEMTPAYSTLADEDVAHIAHLLPNLKVILLLRNPIDRAWSQIRHEWTHGLRARIGDVAEIKTFIDSPAQTLRSSYVRILDTWGQHIPQDRFFVGFYDEIVLQPGIILERVQHFLGLDPCRSNAQDLSRKVQVSREAPMPPEIRSYLAQKYLPEITTLQQRFGGPTAKWLASAKAEA